MTPTRRSLATTNSSNMGATNSSESNADPGQHLAISNDQAQSPSKKESPNEGYQVRTQTQTQTLTQPLLKKPRPFSIPYPRLPSFTAATTEVLRRLTGTPPLPIPDPYNEKPISQNAFIPASNPVPAQRPPSVPLPPPMISAAEAIKLRKEASSKKSPGTPPLSMSTTPTPAPAMSRKRSASKMEHGSSTPNGVSPTAQMFFNSIKTEPRYQPFPSELQSQPDSAVQASTSTTALPPSKPRLGRPPKNRDPSAVQTKTTQTPRGRKRKRSKNSDDESRDKVSDSDSGSEDYTPQTTVTKSGRQIQRPSAYHPPPAPEPSTASPKAPRQQTSKKTLRRKVGESSLCEHCLRGASPNNNQIVFCDGCNRAWHQHCHDPVIEVDVIRDKYKEWFCGGCRKKKEPAPPKVQAPNPTSTPTPAPAPTFVSAPRPVEPPPLDMKGRIGGEAYTGPQKKTYLASLPHQHLVSLLLHASSLNPTLPLFPPMLPPSDATLSRPPSIAPVSDLSTTLPIATIPTYPAPLSSTPLPPPPTTNLTPPTIAQKPRPKPKGRPKTILISPSPSPSDYSSDEELPYPKAGNGIRLPPDSEELEILLDDPYCKTFSHRVRGVQQPVENSMVMSGNEIVRVQGQGQGSPGMGGTVMGGTVMGGTVMGNANGVNTGVGMNWGVRAGAWAS